MLKLGTQITDSANAVYELTGLNIPMQQVKYSLTQPGKDKEADHVMPLKDWRELFQTVNGESTEKAEKKVYLKGQKFRMKDNSEWAIADSNQTKKELVAVCTNRANVKDQPFTYNLLTELVRDGHIKFF